MLEDFGRSDWFELETDVIGGVFLPPIVGKQTAITQASRSRRSPRNSELYNAVIPADRFRYDPATRTYKSTARRLLRDYTFGVLITLRDEGIVFEFERTARRGLDWLSMHYRSAKLSGLRMVIVNNDFEHRADPDETDPGIRVIRDGIYFVAKFKYTKVNRALVEQSGFEFSPKVKWWFTLDPEIAARLDANKIIGMDQAIIPKPDRGRQLSMALECLELRAAPSTVPPPARRQIPDWVRRRYVAKRQGMVPKRVDTRKPIIRTWK